MTSQIQDLTKEVTLNGEAVRNLGRSVDLLRKDLDDLRPLSGLAGTQALRNAHADKDRDTLWKRIDEHEGLHASYKEVVNKAKGFMWAITFVYSLVGAMFMGGLGWMLIAVIDSRELLAVHETRLSELWASRRDVTIISGDPENPAVQKAMSQIPEIKKTVDAIAKKPQVKVISPVRNEPIIRKPENNRPTGKR